MSDALKNKMPAVHHGAWIGPAPTSEEIGLTRPKADRAVGGGDYCFKHEHCNLNELCPECEKENSGDQVHPDRRDEPDQQQGAAPVQDQTTQD